MQVVMNKCFLLNPKKCLAQIRLVVFAKNAHFNSEKNLTGYKSSLVFGSVTSFFGIQVCVFIDNDKTDMWQFFFSGLGENTGIEKQCTRSLTNTFLG